MNFSQYPITIILIALNIAFSVIGFQSERFKENYLLYPYRMKRDRSYIRFLTSGFLHADFMHLFFNMFTLYFFGQIIEIVFKAAFPIGGVWYVLLYVTGMIVADIPSYLKNQDNSYYRSLGASGAVSAVVFAAVVFDPWSQIRLYGVIRLSALLFAILYILFCIYMSKRGGDNVNHDAHLYGSLFGLAFTLGLITIMRPDIFPYIVQDVKEFKFFGSTQIGETLRYILSNPVQP